ncbi:MAG: glycosyltransferase family 39 protein [Thermoanaerobaculaceae bacterium]|nr:glycosyltransferase family 39 protein [Thermoanaerobaculaceae bacterium]
MSRPSTERWRWSGLALAAFVPRIAGAVLRQPWHDEYFTAWAARLPFADLVAALRLDSGPPLPYLLVKLVAGIGLPPLAAARAISVVAGVAAVLLAARAARRTFGPAAGWWAGALLAVHPLAVAWSCEGRAYALVFLAAAWAWERIAALAREGRGAVGLAAAVALACWSHGLGLLLAGVLAVVAVTLRPPERTPALLAVGAGLASHLPWLPVALHQPPAAIAWMAAAWRALPAPERIAAPVRLLSPLGGFAAALDLPSSPWWAETAAAVALGAVVIAGCRVAGAWRPTIGAALPPAALWTLAALGVPAFYPGRGEVLALAPLALLAGAAAGRWRPAALAVLALAAGGAVTSGRALVAWAGAPPSGEQRIAASLRRALPDGGTVVIGGYWRLGVAYHLGAAAARDTLVNVPAEAARHPGWYDPRADVPAPDEVATLARRLLASPAAVAIVVTPGLGTAPVLERLAAVLHLRAALAIPGAVVFLPDAGAR